MPCEPLAQVEAAQEFERALGGRVTVVIIQNCSHAAFAEQPDAIADALIGYARGFWDLPGR